MAATALSPVAEKFIDKCDPEDPEYQKELIRPVEIKEDVKLMEQRKRVTIILKSRKFRKELENALKRKWKNLNLSNSSASLLSVNYISEQLILAAIPKSHHSSFGAVVGANGITPINDLREGVSSHGRKERQLRCKLASLHRLMDMFSWCNLNQHYITARNTTGKDEFLIKPFGIFFHEVTASSLITIDSKGNTIDPGSTILSADNSNWHYHVAIHNARPNLCCVVHMRTPAVINLSSNSKGLLPLSSDAMLLGNVEILEEIVIPDKDDSIQEVTENSDSTQLSTSALVAKLQSQVARALSGQQPPKVLLLPNHGAFVCGKNVEDVWANLQKLQAAAEVQEALCKLPEEDLIIPSSEESKEAILNLWSTSAPSQQDSSEEHELEFEAVMRHLDNSGYRTGYLYQATARRAEESVAETDEMKHNGVSSFPDVEIPAVCSSLWYSGAQYDEGALSDDDAPERTRSMTRSVSAIGAQSSTLMNGSASQWFNTPNVYKRHEDPSSSPLHSARPESCLSPRWVSASTNTNSLTRKAHHPITPGAHVSIQPRSNTNGMDANTESAPVTPAKSVTISKLVDSKEFKTKQKRVKERYYQDKNTAGPQSCLLDGLTQEEARNIREEGINRYKTYGGYGDVPLVTAASKGIVQRSHKDQAVVLEKVFKHSNPFDQVTDEDLQKYKEEVDRKMHPEKYPVAEIEKPEENVKEQEEIVSPKKVEFDQSAPSGADDTFRSSTAAGMTSDSDYPTETRQSVEIPTDASLTAQGQTTEDDNTLDRTKKDKKKKKMFKNPFKKKKKAGKESDAE